MYNTFIEFYGRTLKLNTTDFSYIKLKKAKAAFNSLSIYRHILEDKVVSILRQLVDCLYSRASNLDGYMDLYNRFFFELCSTNTGSFKEYLIDRILFDNNPFSLYSERYSLSKIDSMILNAAKNDLSNLQIISDISSIDIKNSIIECCSPSNFESDMINNLPSWDFTHSEKDQRDFCSADSIIRLLLQSADWSQCISNLANFHAGWGTGAFAKYKAFVWEFTGSRGFLRGVEYPDPITLSDLIGYEVERSEIINNTLNFLKGFPANNILLYGDRGTGKSSTVKAIVNEYYSRGLRIVEVPKSRLIDFPKIVNYLRKSSLKFIVFVDDLAFEDDEENYTALKAVLEGGVEVKPSNVLIYATSNRRHIIKEKFSDRAGLQSGDRDDEIRAADSIQEKLSLADRFGITVVFSSPDKQKYLDIVEGIAKKRGIEVDKDYLHKEALKWELWYNGRSPRTARQFVDWLEGNIQNKSRN